MSSSQEQEQEQESQNDDGGEGVVAMDTATAATTTTTTTWDLAREASSKMVLQSVLDDMETRAAKQKEELQQLRRRADDAESSLSASKNKIETLEAALEHNGVSSQLLEKQVQQTSKETAILRETTDTERERADRSQVESDRLREEIRYVQYVLFVA